MLHSEIGARFSDEHDGVERLLDQERRLVATAASLLPTVLTEVVQLPRRGHDLGEAAVQTVQVGLQLGLKLLGGGAGRGAVRRLRDNAWGRGLLTRGRRARWWRGRMSAHPVSGHGVDGRGRPIRVGVVDARLAVAVACESEREMAIFSDYSVDPSHDWEKERGDLFECMQQIK